MARKFLFSQYVFRQRDLPYNTQLIPLAAICAVIGKTIFDQPKTRDILSQWFWCGIMGEMYGGANESRYANDIDDVVAVIRGNDVPIRTINASFFSATRLLSLQTRNSAAYKGIMALVYREQCRDFMKGTTMDIVKSMDEAPDIHHIFPEAYCTKQGLPREKWNSIVNKTPLLPASNRQIGGNAPSVYSKTIMQKANIDEEQLRARVKSHLINWDAFIQNNFNTYFIDRAKQLLTAIEMAMGKRIADKGSEQTIQGFGCSLEDSPQINIVASLETVEQKQPDVSIELVKQFDHAMMDIYITAKKECGYTATRFLQMISEKGGLATAKQLISKPGGTDGFVTLWQHGRLDLSVEATVLKPMFRELFTEEERRICRERLAQFNYMVDQ